MKKIFTLLSLALFSLVSKAEDVPNPNDEGMKKVVGVISDSNQVETSRKGGANSPPVTGDLGIDLGILILDGILNPSTNYAGFPIYHVKVSEAITLNVGSRESFKVGDCVLVWYAGAMGDNPDLSMPGQAGIAKNNSCKK